jgi:hypothetical protein
VWREVPEGVRGLSGELDLLGVLVRVYDFARLDELGILDRYVVEQVQDHLTLGGVRILGLRRDRKRSRQKKREACAVQ